MHENPAPSRWAKFWGLTRALADRPRDVGRYARYSLGSSTSLQLGLPWFSFAAIDFLEGFLQEDMTIHEYGGGGSTIFFGQRVRKVVTVENDAVWAARISEELRRLEIQSVELRLREGGFPDADEFELTPFATALDGLNADVTVIDSYDADHGHRLRPILFRRAQATVRPGGVIILDDAWRYPRLRSTTSARRVLTLSGVGPARRTATSTDIYFF